MDELGDILGSPIATATFFYGSVLCFVAFGMAVSWLRCEPVRRRHRWLRVTPPVRGH